MMRSTNVVKAGCGVALILGVFATSSSARILPAQYDPEATVDADMSVVVEDADPDETDASVAAYWTPERMANATPIIKTVDAGEVDPSAPAPGGSDDASIDVSSRPKSSALGQLFFTLNGKDMFCSAFAVNSSTSNLVMTAGHCLSDTINGKDYKAEKIIFEPGYESPDPQKPTALGRFHGLKRLTLAGWHVRRREGYDFGFLVVSQNGLNQLHLIVPLALATGLDRMQPSVTLAGYPRNKDDGLTQSTCERATDVPISGSSIGGQGHMIYVKGCIFGEGSSGGPWFQNYESGDGSVLGLTTLGITKGSTKYTSSPYFGERVDHLYKEAKDEAAKHPPEE